MTFGQILFNDGLSDNLFDIAGLELCVSQASSNNGGHNFIFQGIF